GSKRYWWPETVIVGMLISGQCSLSCLLWIVSTVEDLPSIGNHRSRMALDSRKSGSHGLPGQQAAGGTDPSEHAARGPHLMRLDSAARRPASKQGWQALPN